MHCCTDAWKSGARYSNGVINAAGEAFKPVVVYPGKQAHFRRVAGIVQTLHQFLPRCSFYQREMPGVDSAICLDWARFLEETRAMRSNGNHLILICDGYSCHIQLEVLQLLRDNNVVVIGLPAHTSHVLQPLDVSVFSSFKSYLQREFHSMVRAKRVLDAFDVPSIIAAAYSDSLQLTT